MRLRLSSRIQDQGDTSSRYHENSFFTCGCFTDIVKRSHRHIPRRNRPPRQPQRSKRSPRRPCRYNHLFCGSPIQGCPGPSSPVVDNPLFPSCCCLGCKIPLHPPPLFFEQPQCDWNIITGKVHYSGKSGEPGGTRPIGRLQRSNATSIQ
jgi:hypothetical protein